MSAMLIDYLKICNYMGSADFEPLEFDNFKMMNLFVGPNNSGKSIAFRFLSKLNQVFITLRPGVSGLASSHFSLEERNYWAQNRINNISAEIGFRKCAVSEPLADFFGEDNSCRIGLKISSASEGSKGPGWVQISPEIQAQWISPSGTTTNSELNDTIRRIFLTWAQNTRFFDPIRALHRAGSPGQNDGSDLTKQLYDKSTDYANRASYQRLMSSILKRVNELVKPSKGSGFDSIYIVGEDRNRAELWVDNASGPLPILSLGTGIAQLIILCASLTMDNDDTKYYFIEEPESHLHPGLLKRLMHMFVLEEKKQFFLSTHSSAILDSARETTGVYLLTQHADLHCTVKRCGEFTEYHHVLDCLGISGKDLLQSNCVIWVEGPSDRIYLRFWIQETARELFNIDLVEGSDFSIVSFGGKLVAHLSLDSDERNISTKDLVKLLNINRFSALLVDFDEGLSPNEMRIQSEAKLDESHRVAAHTLGREIENDIPSELLKNAAAFLLGLSFSELENCKIGNSDKYAHAIIDFLKVIEGEKESKRALLHQKIKLANVVCDLAQKRGFLGSAPNYIVEIVQLIMRARLPD